MSKTGDRLALGVVRTPHEWRSPVSSSEALAAIGNVVWTPGLTTEFGTFVDGDGLVDVRDTANFALLRFAGKSRAGMEGRALVRAATAGARSANLCRRVRLEAHCGSGVCTGGSWWLPEFPDIRLECPKRAQGAWVQEGLAVSPTYSFAVPEPEAEDLVRYHQVPDELCSLDSARSRGVGDCRSLAADLVDRLTERGKDAWVTHGVIFGVLSAREHSWVSIATSNGPQVLDPTASSIACILGLMTPVCAPASRAFRYFPFKGEKELRTHHACGSWSGSPRWSMRFLSE